jgi:hypothetical protein
LDTRTYLDARSDASDTSDTYVPPDFCAEGSFDNAPQCKQLFDLDFAFQRVWETGWNRVNGDADYRLGIEAPLAGGEATGQITSVVRQQDNPTATVSLDDSNEEITFYFTAYEDKASGVVNSGDTVTLRKVREWSLIESSSYRIAVREVTADTWESACFKTPSGYPETRLVTACSDTVDSGNFPCAESPKPVKVFGIQLQNGNEVGTSEKYFREVSVGEWTAYMTLAFELQPNASPNFCGADGFYADVVLIGPGTEQ